MEDPLTEGEKALPTACEIALRRQPGEQAPPQTLQERAQQAALDLEKEQRRQFAACVSRILQCTVDPATVNLTWTNNMGRHPARVTLDGLSFYVKPGEQICETRAWVWFAHRCACRACHTPMQIRSLAELAPYVGVASECDPTLCPRKAKPDLPVPSAGSAATEQLVCRWPWWQFWRSWKGNPCK